MTYREPANAPLALVRPPPILGFAFYLLGTGCMAMGIAELAVFAQNAFAARVASLPGSASVIGQAMVLVGLAIAWRTTKGAQRRLLGASATLALTLFVLEVQRGPIVEYLVAHAPRSVLASTSAGLLGRAIVLLVVAVVVHGSGRAFAARTWATTLGATLLFADAFVGAWLIVTQTKLGEHGGRLFYASPSLIVGGVGLLVAGGGLYSAGATILRGITIDEYLRAHRGAKSAEDDGVSTAASADRRLLLLRGLPPFVEGLIALAGLALAHAASVAVAARLGLSAHDVSDTATLGGELVAWSVVFVAAHRMRALMKRSFLVGAVLAAIVLDLTLRYLLWSRGVFSGVPGRSLPAEVLPFVAGARALLTVAALHAVASALDGFAVLKNRARLASSLVGVSLAVSLLASFASVAPDLLQAVAAALAAVALAVAVGAAREARRIEIALNR